MMGFNLMVNIFMHNIFTKHVTVCAEFLFNNNCSKENTSHMLRIDGREADVKEAVY
jgi:hypothetical protein